MQVYIPGGDLRSKYLSEWLIGRNINVIRDVPHFSNCENEEAKVLLLPLRGKGLSDEEKEQLNAVLLPKGSHIYSFGREVMFDSFFQNNVDSKRCVAHDLNLDNDFLEKNAVATAEGTICLLIENIPVNINGSRCLVVGFGRCGKEIVKKLLVLGADVTVYSHGRPGADKAFEKEYDAVINTAPAPVLSKEVIDQLFKGSKDPVIIDIASMPGGTDFNYCDEKDIKAIHALGLPGVYSPKTSGILIGKSMWEVVNEA